MTVKELLGAILEQATAPRGDQVHDQIVRNSFQAVHDVFGIMNPQEQIALLSSDLDLFKKMKAIIHLHDSQSRPEA